MLVAIAAVFATGVVRAEYRSIGEAAAVMYDGPSLRATRVFVASRGLPVEVISSDGTWVKVRDPGGDLAWVERKALSDRRTVLVTSALADVRRAADETSPVLFQVAQGVVLEFHEQTGAQPGWIRVRHRDGTAGFIRIREIWGV
jgi:SH3 domain protein